MDDWTKELNNTPESSTLPKKQLKAKGKPGPKKSKVDRKVVGLNFSVFESKRLTRLERELQSAGIELTRGRSEAAELAITFLLSALKPIDNDSSTQEKSEHERVTHWLKTMHGIEDKYEAEKTNDSD